MVVPSRLLFSFKDGMGLFCTSSSAQAGPGCAQKTPRVGRDGPAGFGDITLIRFCKAGQELCPDFSTALLSPSHVGPSLGHVPTLPGSSTKGPQQGAPDLIQPYWVIPFDWLMPCCTDVNYFDHYP